MRHHFKTRGLISSTNPSGHSFISKSVRLRKKFLNGDITEEELHELVESGNHTDLVISGRVEYNTPVNKEGEFKTLIIFGKEMKISIEEHRVHSTLVCLDE